MSSTETACSSANDDAVFTVWASGLAPIITGVGVFQRQIYARLSADPTLRLVLGPDHERWSGELSEYRPGLRRLRDVADFTRSLWPPTAEADVAFLTTTPLPALIRQPCVGVVYDLRWRRTRGVMARLYRRLDLARLVRKARRLIAISERTRTDLVGLFPAAAAKTSVVHLGPGNVRDGLRQVKEPGTVLLVGSAPYKRNRLAAEMLAGLHPSWAQRIVGLSLSGDVMAVLEERFGKDRCEWFSQLDEAAAGDLYARAETFICLSLEEGFGLPFVEALAAGCSVVAVRQPLTEALLKDAAVLLADGTREALARQLEIQPRSSWPPAELRRSVASEFSWESAASTIATALREAAGSR